MGGEEYAEFAESRGERGEEDKSEESDGPGADRDERSGAPIIGDDDRWHDPLRERRRVTEVAARRSSRGSLEESRIVERILTAREAVAEISWSRRRESRKRRAWRASQKAGFFRAAERETGTMESVGCW